MPSITRLTATLTIGGRGTPPACRRFAAVASKKHIEKPVKINGSTMSHDKRSINLPPNIRRIDRSSFDIFAKLDSTDKRRESARADENPSKRKPSQRVVALADKILALSLVEAADLCELCQEALQARPLQEPLPARNPFPHPGGFFSGAPFGGFPAVGMVPAPIGVSMQYPATTPQTAPGTPPLGVGQQDPKQDAASPPPPPPPSPAPKPVCKEPEVVALKLVDYDSATKIAVIKEVRAMLGLGLKESKDTVEASPRVLKRGIPREEALKLKVKLEAAGATVALE